MRKKFIPVLLAFVSLTSLISTPAHAASHDVKGCLLVEDSREASSTYNSWVGVPEFEFEIWFKALGILWKAGTLTTNASGCFNGTLSGIGVPNNTTVTFRATLETSTYKAFDDGGTVYYYEFASKSVGAGDTANLGDFYVGDSATPDYAHGSILLWRSATDAVDTYKSKVAGWSGFPVLGLRYPYSGDPANANTSRIAMPFDEKSNYKTFLHEFGHFTSMNDASSTSGTSSYCVDYAGCGAYPCDRIPYTMTETKTSDCGHNAYNYEAEDRSLIEGYAEFFADYLYDGICRNDSEGTWMKGLNFDAKNREMNAAHALCDLVDGAPYNETETWMHAYGKGSNFTELGVGVLNASAYAGTDGTWAYASLGGADVYRVDFATGAATKIVTMPFTPERVAVDGTTLCAYSGSQLSCSDTAGTGPLTTATNPSAAGTYLDLELADGNIYALFQEGAYFRIYASPFDGTWTWAESYSEIAMGGETDIESIAVDATSGKLFIGREHEIESCDLSNCAATLADYAGSATQFGYKRGAGASSWFNDIRDLTFAAATLHVTDSYGVARVDSAGNVEQYVGAGADNVFLNNLHRRSLYSTNFTSMVFVTNGMRGLIDIEAVTPDVDRSGAPGAQTLFAFDDAQPDVTDVYCGTDTADLATKDVVQMFQGKNIVTDIDTALGYVSGITTADKTGVRELNWLKLNKEGCTFASGEEELSTSSGSTSVPGSESDTGSTCSGTADEDEDTQTKTASSATKVTGSGPGGLKRATPAIYPRPKTLTGRTGN